MSLILLINGLIDILICMLLFFYTNKFKYRMSKRLVIIFSSFSLCTLFVGFLRLRIAMVYNTWHWYINQNEASLFGITHFISSLLIAFFLYATVFKINFKNV